MAGDVAHTTRRLELPVPYDAARLFQFLASRAIPGVEAVERLGRGWRYRRSLRLPGGPAVGEIVVLDRTAQLSVRAIAAADTPGALSAMQRLLDLEPAPAVVDRTLAKQPETAALAGARPGLRVPRAADRAELAFRALIGQQVSVAAASTTCGFIAAQYGDPLPRTLRHAPIDRQWPAPAILADIDPQTLPMPRTKALAVTTLAAALRDGAVDLAVPGPQVRHQLLALKGIGPWTAGYISMRGCADHDVLLDTDLIVRRGAQLVGLPDDPRRLRAAGERFAPWRSYLTMHLWQAYAAS